MLMVAEGIEGVGVKSWGTDMVVITREYRVLWLGVCIV